MTQSILMLLGSIGLIAYGDRTNEILPVIFGFCAVFLSLVHLYFIAEVELNRS